MSIEICITLLLSYVHGQNMKSATISGVSASSVRLMSSGALAVLQAPIFDSLLFDPFLLLENGLCPAEVIVGTCDVVQPLAIAPMVVVLDERFDLALEDATRPSEAWSG